MLGITAMQACSYAHSAETPPKYAPLPGRAVGMLVSDARAALAEEGRAGPADAVLFSRDGASYRWLYLTVGRGERGDPATVEVGVKEGEEQTFENLVLASSEILSRRGIAAQYALVEVEVNAGKGSPSTDRFVATGLRVLDGSPDFPARIDSLVKDTLQDCRTREPPEAKQLFEKLRQETLPGSAPLQRDLKVTPHITWLSQERRVDVTCTVAIVGQERKPSIGIVRQQPFRAEDTEASFHGKQFGVTWSRSFAITPAGRTELKSETAVVPFTRIVPPAAAPYRSAR